MTHDGSTNQIPYNLTTDSLSVLGAASPTSEFIQAVVTHDTSSPFETVFYINGIEVGTANNNDNWSGGDAAGFGARGDNNVGGLGSGQLNTESFDGQMALIRMYRDQILTPAEVTANYDALSGPDTTAPSITSTDPVDDATGIYRGATLTATFSEDIAQLDGGTVTLTDLTNGTDTRVIGLLDGQVSVNGADLIIAPSPVLAYATEYEVTIDGNAIVDLADTPNAYGGTASGEFTFTVAAEDLTAPVISSTDPVDDATGVTPFATLTATFDENIVAGSGNITIVDVTNGGNFAVIPIGDPQVTIAGTTLTIDPTTDFVGAVEYAVQIDAGAVENFSNVDFAGIADTTTWSFTTTDTTTYDGPTTTSSDTWNNPSNWDAGVPTGALNAVIPDGELVTVDADPPNPPYTGNLTLGVGSTIRIEWLGSDSDYYDALGTPGQTVITAGAGSLVNCRAGDPGYPVEWPELVLTGDHRIVLSQSTQPSVDIDFDNGISGTGTLIIQGKGGSNANLNTSNTMTGFLASEPGSGGSAVDIHANAAGSLGTGDVTVNAIANSSNGTVGRPVADLIIEAADAMADTANVTLSGDTTGFTLITMNADDTVATLSAGGFARPAGTYGRVGTPASVTYEAPWIAGDSVLTVTSAAGLGTGTFTITGGIGNMDNQSGGALTLTTNNAIALNQNLTFAGTDDLNMGTGAVTMNSNRTITVQAETPTLGGPVGGGNRQLTKAGSGVLALGGSNTYTNNTNVDAGTLALVSGSQASPIIVASGASLDFTLGSTITSSSSVDLTNGTVTITGAVDNSSDYQLMTATGGFTFTDLVLQLGTFVFDYELELQNTDTELWLVYTGGGGGTTYDSWSGGAPPEGDANGDGVQNAVAYALGAADVNENAIGLLPTLDNTTDPTYFIFSFNRDDDAEADPTTTISVEWGTDLSGWNTAANDSPSPGDVVITETGSDPTNVEVKIARSLAVDGKLFSRLMVEVAPPAFE